MSNHSNAVNMSLPTGRIVGDLIGQEDINKSRTVLIMNAANEFYVTSPDPDYSDLTTNGYTGAENQLVCHYIPTLSSFVHLTRMH